MPKVEMKMGAKSHDIIDVVAVAGFAVVVLFVAGLCGVACGSEDDYTQLFKSVAGPVCERVGAAFQR